MTALSDLIARLEAAKEGSRELDAEIAVKIFETQKTDDDLIYTKACARSDNCAVGTYWHVQRSGMSLRTAPPYTTSLDAALTLVPEGGFWRCGNGGGFPARAEQWASVFRGNYREENGQAPTVPLALCIAALKAGEGGR